MKRKEIPTSHDRPTKRIKLEWEPVTEQECNVFIRVFAIKELLATIFSFLEDNTNDKYKKHQLCHVSLCAWMLSMTSKSLYQSCITCSRENFHGYYSLRDMMHCSLEYGYVQCFEFMKDINPSVNPDVEFVKPDVNTIELCKKYKIHVPCSMWHRFVEQGVECIQAARGYVPSICGLMNTASMMGSLEVIRLLKTLDMDWVQMDLVILASKGHVHCMKEFEEELLSPRWRPELFDRVIDAAARECRLESLKYLMEKGFNPVDDVVSVTGSSCRETTRYEECVEFLLSKGYGVTRKACLMATLNGSITYLKKFGTIMDGIDEDVVEEAARINLEILKCAHKLCGSMPTGAVENARKDIEAFDYALDSCDPKELHYKTLYEMDAEHMERIEKYNAKHGTNVRFEAKRSMSAIEYLLSRGQFSQQKIVRAAMLNGVAGVDLLIKYGVKDVRVNFTVDIHEAAYRKGLKYALKRKVCKIDIWYAHERRDMDMVKFLLYDVGVTVDPVDKARITASMRSPGLIRRAIDNGDSVEILTALVAKSER